MALATRVRFDGKEQKVVCSHCQRSSHDSGNCFALIGYPEWWGDRPRNDSKSGGRGKEHGFGRGGGRGNRGMARANAVQTTSSAKTANNMTTGELEGTRVPGLNDEQWERLLAMLNKPKSMMPEKMTGKTWIIDTGATNHMTCMIKELGNVKEIPNCPVGLPDGSTTSATKVGSINLTDNFHLNNVLYVSGLNCNLISVSQLTDS